jgi:hypothetical protein
MADDISWEKILATALVSSFFTACVTEPVKAYIQRHLKRNELRRSLYQEIMSNFAELYQQVDMAKHDDEMKTGIDVRFAMGYKRLAYDLAQKDAATFYNIGHRELYWIELLYRDFQHVIDGRFTDEAQRLSNAEFTANSVLHNLKGRRMSKRLAFKVCRPWVKKHFREHLPKMSYIGREDSLSLAERLRRRYDQAQYWVWRKFY